MCWNCVTSKCQICKNYVFIIHVCLIFDLKVIVISKCHSIVSVNYPLGVVFILINFLNCRVLSRDRDVFFCLTMKSLLFQNFIQCISNVSLINLWFLKYFIKRLKYLNELWESLGTAFVINVPWAISCFILDII